MLGFSSVFRMVTGFDTANSQCICMIPGIQVLNKILNQKYLFNPLKYQTLKKKKGKKTHKTPHTYKEP